MNTIQLNTVSLNAVPLNSTTEFIRKRKPSSGGGTTPDIPDGYEQFLVDEGVFLVDEGAFLVLK
jgi:hypothetical protein